MAGRLRQTHPLPYVLVAPLLALFALTFLAPFVLLFVNSLRSYDPAMPLGGISGLQQYERFLVGPGQGAVIARTARITLLTALFCLIIGYPTALIWVRVGSRLRAAMTFAILTPLLTSVIARTFGWWTLLGPGSMGALFGQRQGLLFTEAAAVIGLVHILLPYMVLPVVASVQNIEPSLRLAARSLGANTWTVVWKVDIPLSLQGLLGGMLLVTSLSLSSFVTPSMLAGSRNDVVAVQIYRVGFAYFNWPLAAAGAVLLLMVASLLVLINIVVLGRDRARSIAVA
jgi:putative spermidine/putrescine transport system permease protein